MFQILTKIIFTVFFWGIFIFVIFQVSYPQTLTQANKFQLLSFFIPLLLALSLTFNLFLKNILTSFSIASGLIILLILKALDSLNLITIVLTLSAVGLLVSYFRKIKKKNLTKLPKIPTLTKFIKK